MPVTALSSFFTDFHDFHDFPDFDFVEAARSQQLNVAYLVPQECMHVCACVGQSLKQINCVKGKPVAIHQIHWALLGQRLMPHWKTMQ